MRVISARRIDGGHGVVGVSGDGVECGRHEAEDDVEGDGAEDGDAVDVAVEDFAREEKECAVEEDVKEGAVKVAVVHEVLVDAGEGVEDGECLRVDVLLANWFDIVSLWQLRLCNAPKNPSVQNSIHHLGINHQPSS